FERSIWSRIPRSSTAAKPWAAAKSSVWIHVHFGEPSVEKPIGSRLDPDARDALAPPALAALEELAQPPSAATAAAAPAVARNRRRSIPWSPITPPPRLV